MEITFSKSRITLAKELNSLDELALDFAAALDSLGVSYVFVSGYVSILFGRSRTSEDIDIFIERISPEKFSLLWEKLSKSFGCINTRDGKEAFSSYLSDKHALRFARKGSFIPNIECKFPKTELDAWTLGHRVEVILNGRRLFISPLELQIPYKLFLGSEKDIEDAKYLSVLFKNKLDATNMREFAKSLGVEAAFKRYIDETSKD